MTATEELRSLLDERGVEWRYDIGIVDFEKDGRWYSAWAYSDGAMCVSMGYLTPAQVVEATLGNGPLTAEVVEKIVDRNCEWYEGGEIDAQAIADELNAVLGASSGRGECRMQLRDDIRGHAYQDTYECSGCCEQVLRETFMGESEPPRYCPNCGRKVVGNDKHSM